MCECECVCDLVCWPSNGGHVHLNYSHLSALQCSGGPWANCYLCRLTSEPNRRTPVGECCFDCCCKHFCHVIKAEDVCAAEERLQCLTGNQASVIFPYGLSRSHVSGSDEVFTLLTKDCCYEWTRVRSVCERAQSFYLLNCLHFFICFIDYIHSSFVSSPSLLTDLSTFASLSHFPRLPLHVWSQSDCIRLRLRSLELLI